MNTPRRLLVKGAKKLTKLGLITGSEGNVSLRQGEKIFTTPTGVLKDDLAPEDIVVVDPEGRCLSGGKPSSELLMHLNIYRRRGEIKAVVHAHPPFTLALDLAGYAFDEFYLIEAALFLKKIAVVPFALPGTPDLPKQMEPYLDQTNVFVLSRHGAVTLGKDLEQALNLMCILEQVSRVTWLAKTLRPKLPPLSPEIVKNCFKYQGRGF